MKKFLLIMPIIFGTLCTLPGHADNDMDDFLLGKDRTRSSAQCTTDPTTQNQRRICYSNTGTGGGAQNCANGSSENAQCTNSRGASYARCQYNGGSVLKCTAKTCTGGYFLWVTSSRSKTKDIEKFGYNAYQSQGVCIPANWCELKGCPTCTLHTFDWKNPYNNQTIQATDEICYEVTTSDETPPEPDSTCTLGFNGSTHVIQSVNRGLSSRSPTKSSIYTNTADQNISNIHDLHLFDLTTVDGQDISTIPGFFDQGVNVSDLRTAIEAEFFCNTGSPKIQIRSPSPEETPVDETPTCELTFSNGTIKNVSLAESIKTDSAKTSVELWRPLDTNRTETQSAYADKNKSVFKQNYSSSAQNYDANTPHLFDVAEVSKTIGSTTTVSNVTSTQQSDFQNARYIKFDCNTDGFFTINNGIKILSATVECTDKTQCNDLDVFNKIDKYTKYFEDKTSAWTNAEGGFNTARLASDSIAGVVLGTVGGIVTSKVIKKNQIKNGFEDLKCTIGGQDVATYGDEFTVGVK